MARFFVGVSIDTSNHEYSDKQTFASVLEQDFPADNREIIVVDNGLQDRTPEIVSRFAPQVRLIREADGGHLRRSMSEFRNARGNFGVP
jgi:glycosyltransferase involved in cell wall biosynthesis